MIDSKIITAAFVLLILLTGACNTDSEKPSTDRNRVADDRTQSVRKQPSDTVLSPTELMASIETAYADSSSEQLDTFFRQWHESVKGRDLSTIGDSIEKDVNQIYLALFDPFNISRLGESEWGKDFYTGVRYVVIQNKISYKVGDTKDEEFKTIDNFRPLVSFPDADVVYLKPVYRDVLLGFLGTESVPLGTGNIMAPARAVGESKKRLDFANRLVKIVHGHWGGWYLETHPFVEAVVFDESRDRVTVYFRLVYQGGEARFVKTGTNWVLQKSGLTWIE